MHAHEGCTHGESELVPKGQVSEFEDVSSFRAVLTHTLGVTHFRVNWLEFFCEVLLRPSCVHAAMLVILCRLPRLPPLPQSKLRQGTRWDMGSYPVLLSHPI